MSGPPVSAEVYRDLALENAEVARDNLALAKGFAAQIRELRSALIAIRDSTHKSAITLRGMAADALERGK